MMPQCTSGSRDYGLPQISRVAISLKTHGTLANYAVHAIFLIFQIHIVIIKFTQTHTGTIHEINNLNYKSSPGSKPQDRAK